MYQKISMPGASIPLSCQACPFRERDIFASASPQVRMPILSTLQHRQVPARHAVYHANDPGESVYVVRAGLVKLVQHSSSGTQRIVRLVTGGDTIGLESVLGEPYRHSALAVGDVQLCRVSAKAIRAYGCADSGFVQAMLSQMQASLDAADAFLTEMSTGRVSSRVARLLLYLSTRQNNGYCPKLSTTEMGAVVGLTPESVSRVVSRLKRAGVLQPAGRPGWYGCNTASLSELAAA